MRRKLLVVDDDPVGCRLIEAIFTPEGYDVIDAHDGPSALEIVSASRPDAVLLDLRLPGMDGIVVLEKLRQIRAGLPVIMLTGHAEVKSAVRAIQLGAFDYRTKPIDPDEIVLVVRRALETRALELEVTSLRAQLNERAVLCAQMGPSREVCDLVEQVRLVAASSFTVLVAGETGTGKELIAQAIHRKSERRSKPFIALDCGALPENLVESELFGYERGAFSGADRRKEGRFQLAEGGTFFLDEVGNLPLSLQGKLLRVLESREVLAVGGTKAKPLDVRFVAATNRDLRQDADAGRFRPDLYFRLAQYTIAVPPLRSRPSDIAYLAQRFLEEASIELRRPVRTIAAEALQLLTQYGWPGNVRELRNVVRQGVLHARNMVLDCEVIRNLLDRSGGPSSAPIVAVGSDADRSLKEIAERAAAEAQRQAICETLRATRGNKTHAAKALKTDYKTLHLKMKLFGIRARDFMPD